MTYKGSYRMNIIKITICKYGNNNTINGNEMKNIIAHNLFYVNLEYKKGKKAEKKRIKGTQNPQREADPKKSADDLINESYSK